jgi:hypothetical protein
MFRISPQWTRRWRTVLKYRGAASSSTFVLGALKHARLAAQASEARSSMSRVPARGIPWDYPLFLPPVFLARRFIPWIRPPLTDALHRPFQPAHGLWTRQPAAAPPLRNLRATDRARRWPLSRFA